MQVGVAVAGDCAENSDLSEGGAAQALTTFHFVSGHTDVIGRCSPCEVDLQIRRRGGRQVGWRGWRYSVTRNNHGKHRGNRVALRPACSGDCQVGIADRRAGGSRYRHGCRTRGGHSRGVERRRSAGGEAGNREIDGTGEVGARNYVDGVACAVAGNYGLCRWRECQRKIRCNGNGARGGAWISKTKVVGDCERCDVAARIRKGDRARILRGA